MDENREESLCEAARNGDVDRVKSLIASGADVTYFDADGITPLMHAAKNGCAEVVKELLDGGAPWNALSPSNISAGDFAMDNGHQSAFDILLNAVQSDMAMKWCGKMLKPIRKVWSKLSKRIGLRKHGLVKFHQDVRSCEYEDVHILWDMLKRNQTDGLTTNKRSFWSNCSPLLCRAV